MGILALISSRIRGVVTVVALVAAIGVVTLTVMPQLRACKEVQPTNRQDAGVPVTERPRSRPTLSKDPKPTRPEPNVVSRAVIKGSREPST
jgi:hypothetical protein